MSSSITSANAIVMLAVTGVFDSPQQLREFSADNIFSSEEIEFNQPVMGVDGVLTAGRVNNPVPQTFMLQADSISMGIFEDWVQAEIQNEQVYYAQATVQLNALGTKWTCVKGVLQRGRRLPDAAKVLQPRSWTVVWESVTPNPVG